MSFAGGFARNDVLPDPLIDPLADPWPNLLADLLADPLADLWADLWAEALPTLRPTACAAPSSVPMRAVAAVVGVLADHAARYCNAIVLPSAGAVLDNVPVDRVHRSNTQLV